MKIKMWVDQTGHYEVIDVKWQQVDDEPLEILSSLNAHRELIELKMSDDELEELHELVVAELESRGNG